MPLNSTAHSSIYTTVYFLLKRYVCIYIKNDVQKL